MSDWSSDVCSSDLEGFRYDGYIDIFDGGPAMAVRTDQLRRGREAKASRVSRPLPTAQGVPAIIAAGRTSMFNATFANIGAMDDSVLIDGAGMAILNLHPGDELIQDRKSVG